MSKKPQKSNQRASCEQHQSQAVQQKQHQDQREPREGTQESTTAKMTSNSNPTPTSASVAAPAPTSQENRSQNPPPSIADQQEPPAQAGPRDRRRQGKVIAHQTGGPVGQSDGEPRAPARQKRLSSAQHQAGSSPTPQPPAEPQASAMTAAPGPPAANQAKQNICAACARPIRDRYLLMALDKHWHEDCLKCACCDCRLAEAAQSFYFHSEQLLCKRDFYRIFGTPGNCAACRRTIPAYDHVMRANELVYHMDCFTCLQCQYRFCVGDLYHLTETHKIICLMCYSEHQSQQKLNHPPQHSTASATTATTTITAGQPQTTTETRTDEAAPKREATGQEGEGCEQRPATKTPPLLVKLEPVTRAGRQQQVEPVAHEQQQQPQQPSPAGELKREPDENEQQACGKKQRLVATLSTQQTNGAGRPKEQACAM